MNERGLGWGGRVHVMSVAGGVVFSSWTNLAELVTRSVWATSA